MIAAIVVAAGESKRMGCPKLAMPWGDTTVIGKVVLTLFDAGLSEIVVVTGGARQEVEAALRRSPSLPPGILRFILNPGYAAGEMLSSIQAGLSSLGEGVRAALLALGDQPQMQIGVVKMVVDAYQAGHAPLIVPSYRMRRGHPWIIARSLWEAVLSLHAPQTMRDFLRQHQEQIGYVNVETPTILSDLDTPEDYRRDSPFV